MFKKIKKKILRRKVLFLPKNAQNSPFLAIFLSQNHIQGDLLALNMCFINCKTMFSFNYYNLVIFKLLCGKYFQTERYFFREIYWRFGYTITYTRDVSVCFKIVTHLFFNIDYLGHIRSC